jgi:hypothetical protein
LEYCEEGPSWWFSNQWEAPRTLISPSCLSTSLQKYRKDCPGVKADRAPQRSGSGPPSGSLRKDRKQGDRDKIMKNAKDGSVF